MVGGARAVDKQLVPLQALPRDEEGHPSAHTFRRVFEALDPSSSRTSSTSRSVVSLPTSTVRRRRVSHRRQRNGLISSRSPPPAPPWGVARLVPLPNATHSRHSLECPSTASPPNDSAPTAQAARPALDLLDSRPPTRIASPLIQHRREAKRRAAGVGTGTP